MLTETIFSLLTACAMIVSADQKPRIKTNTNLPTHYGVLLTPSVDPTDVFGPLGVLTSLGMYYMNDTGKMHLSVLSANRTSSTTNPPLTGFDFGVGVPPSLTFADYLSLKANNFTNHAHCNITKNSNGTKSSSASFGPLDVLLVPGGGGARMNVSSEIAFIKEIYPSLKYIISVCTGSTILARAGILDGRHATTNKKAWTWATSFGTNVMYEPVARWVKDGNIYTGSGVSAAIDTTYAFVADVYGEEVSQWVADASEYTRWKNASYDPFAARWAAS